MILSNEIFLERFGYFLTKKNDSESQNLAIFDNFHSADLNFFFFDFGPKGRPGRMCNSVR